MKRFCFRFDVDTENCIRNGVPKLLEVSDELGVRFTFFVNMGRAAKRTSYLQKRFQRKQAEAPKLPNIEKLGKANFLRVALLNPLAGSANKEILKKICDAGHEVGLHGGRNHGDWMRNAKNWGFEKLKNEIAWGTEEIEKAVGKKPLGFASPGFVTNDLVLKAIEANGFLYCSEQFGLEKRIEKLGELINVPVNFCGEGGVGFIDSMRALKKTDNEILQQLDFFSDSNELIVTYDHPGYAGLKELSLVKKLCLGAKKKGFKFVTMKEIALEWEK